jgi:hypothetical protein
MSEMNEARSGGVRVRNLLPGNVLQVLDHMSEDAEFVGLRQRLVVVLFFDPLQGREGSLHVL